MLNSIQSLDTLVVGDDDNPITSLSLWKQYAIVKLNLISINDDVVSYHITCMLCCKLCQKVTTEQAATSRQLFEPLVSLSNQHTTPVHDKARNDSLCTCCHCS